MGASADGPGSIYEAASYPPFNYTSANTARMLLNGELRRLVEVLSVNGHIIMEAVVSGRDGVVVRLYWSGAPLASGVAREWRVVFDRLVGVLPRLEESAGGARYGEPWPGWGSAELGPVGDPYVLAALIGGARSVAGVRPYTGLPHGDVLPLYTNNDVGNTLSGALGLDTIIDWYDLPEELVVKLAAAGLYWEAYPPREAAEVAGDVSPRHVRNLYRRLEELGVLRVCRSGGRYRYLVDLRNEVILSTLLDIGEDAGLPCGLLPLVEGVSFADWRIFPGPYKRCKPIVEDLSGLTLEWGEPPC